MVLPHPALSRWERVFYSREFASICGFFRLAKRLANSQNLTQQLGGLGGDVRLPHEGCADEDGICPARLQSLDVGPALDAALSDEHYFGAATFGDALGQALGGAEIDGEVGQVAVVDADQPGVDGQGRRVAGLNFENWPSA